MFSRNKLIMAAMVVAAIIPVVAFAASMPNIWPTGYWATNGLLSCTGNYLPQGQGGPTGPGPTKPCQSLCDLIQTVLYIIALAMSIALFIITPVMILWGGIMIMVAGANPGTLETGKKILTGTVIGIAIILCSYLLVATAVNVLGVSGVGGFSGNVTCPSTPTTQLSQ